MAVQAIQVTLNHLTFPRTQRPVVFHAINVAEHPVQFFLKPPRSQMSSHPACFGLDTSPVPPVSSVHHLLTVFNYLEQKHA
jgi:hypothetical protein